MSWVAVGTIAVSAIGSYVTKKSSSSGSSSGSTSGVPNQPTNNSVSQQPIVYNAPQYGDFNASVGEKIPWTMITVIASGVLVLKIIKKIRT